MERNDAVFILTHGRADNVVTYKTLRRQGYTGRIYLIIDDEDKQGDKYRENFGEENVITFSKEAAAEYTDTADTKPERNVVVFARNTCHKIAADLGLTHFCEVDDDYGSFHYRAEVNGQLKGFAIKSLDKVFDAMYDFLDVTGAVTVAPAQGGDYIGGLGGIIWRSRVRRKAMNMFFCRTDRPFQFYGRLNEDTTAYTYLGQQGKLFLQVADWKLDQGITQANAGGLTDAYLALGTYVKTFYSILYSPSCVKVATLGDGSTGTRHERIHHYVDWNHCTPMILSEKWKKDKHGKDGKTDD